MRCAIEVQNNSSGLQVDVRLDASNPKTSVLAAPKEIESDGQVSVLVPDEDLFGKPASVVIVDGDGVLMANAETKIGG